MYKIEGSRITISKHFQINKLQELKDILKNIEEVRLNDVMDINIIDFLPDHITQIDMGYLYNVQIKKWPNNLKDLVIGNNYHYSLDNLPQNLQLLCMNGSSKIDNLPEGLIELRIGGEFKNSIDNLPSNLRFLQIGGNFSQKLDNLPKSLESLYIVDRYYGSLDNLPENLISLEINNSYNKPLDFLPRNLKRLVLFDFCNSVANFPNGLKHLSISNCRNLDINCLPDSIEFLVLGCRRNVFYLGRDRFFKVCRFFNEEIKKLPSNLKTIILPDDYCYINSPVFSSVHLIKVGKFSM